MVVGLYVAFLVIVDTYLPQDHYRVELILIASLFMAVYIALLFVMNFVRKRKREEIKKSFDYYVENLVSVSGIGLIAFNEDSEIIWTSQFIAARYKQNLLGKKVSAISPEFEKKYLAGDRSFWFDLNGVTYEAEINFENRAVILKDVTAEKLITDQYASEKVVLGELEIDNFQQLQSTLPEEELFRAQAQVINLLDRLVTKYNIVYRQYVNGKYIIVTNQKTLDLFIEDKFNFLDRIRKYFVLDGVQLTVSIGFGAGSALQSELLKMAKTGLLQAQARGGDQIGVNIANTKPLYFGSKSEIANTLSRVKIKQITKLLEHRISDSNIKNVVIYGHQYADLDAVGAAVGMFEFAKTFKNNVFIQNSTFDSTTEDSMSQLFTKEENQYFISPARARKILPKEQTLVIVVDTADLSRIENRRALTKVDSSNIFIFDHHRVMELPKLIDKTNVYIDTTASSAVEIVTEVIRFSKSEIKVRKAFAQMMLNGIYLDTKHFTNSVSSRTFSAASFLETKGALPTIASETLKLSENDSRQVGAILRQVEEIKPGYFISSSDLEVSSDIVSAAADEILRTHGRKAAFVIAKIPGKKAFKLSARGIDANVQVIAEAVGGGGHFSASAAVSEEPLKVFTDNVIQAIVSKKGDS